MINCALCGASDSQVVQLRDIFLWRSCQQQWLCAECESHFQWIGETHCSTCGRLTHQLKETLCADCCRWLENRQWQPHNYSLVTYNEGFKRWLIQLKGVGDIRVASYFSPQLQKIYQQYREAIWVPIPSSSHNLQARGFNQTTVILAEAKIPYQELLIYPTETQKQALRTRQERLSRANPFEWNPNIVHQHIEEPIVLFDDVYTTGMTIYQAEQVLKQHQINVVQSITLAR